MKRQDAETRLYELAAQQGGFFTTRQAKASGYADNTHPHHVRAGNWVRERRGIYRLARFPLAARPDLIIWQLWSQNRRGEPQGTYSHSTALSLHQLSDVMPSKSDMTVPPGFQRMATIPRALRLHTGRLAEDDVETIESVRVTTPLRTLIDVIVEDRLARELQVQAVQDALRRGLVTLRQFDLVQASRRVRQRINTVLKQVPDGDSTPVRHSRGFPGGTRNAPARAVTTRRP